MKEKYRIMERRSLFKQLGMASVAAALPLIGERAQAATTETFTLSARHPFHRFKLGQLELTVVTDGKLTMKPVQPFFAPDIDPAQVKTLLQNSFRSTEQVELGMNILVIRNGKRVIMIDAGAGNNFGPDCGWLPQTLVDAGFRLEDITDVVLTHAHPDHMGGLLDKANKLLLPNAQVHVSKTEHDFWLQPSQDFSRSKFNDMKVLQAMIDGMKSTLGILRPRLHFFDNDAVLLDCIRLKPAPGHTPGHTLVEVFSGDAQLWHIGDLVHSDVLLFPHPEWGFYGDTDFAQAAATRRREFEALADSRALTLAYHLPWPGLGHVRKKDDAFEWIAESYATPYAAGALTNEAAGHFC